MNCACHEQIALNELVLQINNSLGKNVETIYAKPREGDIKHSFADIKLIKEKLNFIPNTSFVIGLKKTIDLFTQQ